MNTLAAHQCAVDDVQQAIAARGGSKAVFSTPARSRMATLPAHACNRHGAVTVISTGEALDNKQHSTR
jgi:hypothetical protein